MLANALIFTSLLVYFDHLADSGPALGQQTVFADSGRARNNRQCMLFANF